MASKAFGRQLQARAHCCLFRNHNQTRLCSSIGSHPPQPQFDTTVPAQHTVEKTNDTFEKGPAPSSLNHTELAKFAAIADTWWDSEGPFKPLHAINPTRLAFIRSTLCRHFGKDPCSPKPFEGLKIIDVGCGGGILSEPLARMGATVTGVDAVEKNIKIARLHADLDPVTSTIEYCCTTAEKLVEEQRQFDAVMALEVIEHVSNPAEFCKSLEALTVPGGATVISTVNRTMRAYATAIFVAEYVLRWLPKGTHQWSSFLTPEELVLILQRLSLDVKEMAGFEYNPLTGRWLLSDDIGVNFIAYCTKKQTDMSPAVIEGNDAVTGHIISTTIGGKNGEPKRTISYMAERAVGKGTFGIVFQAKCIETGETVAIKKVLQDRRYKNRELQLMRLMDHPNVISLKHFFSTTTKDELFQNLVMEYVPESMFRVLKHYSSVNQRMPLIYVKLYTYQIFRGLAYIHTVPGVCHRDVKPENLLVDPLTHQAKLCDFGSAKVLVKGEANISYICSRYYRAPELIFGATEYTTSIDIWSAGCVLAELLLGQPLFPGENVVDQLVEIIKVLGTPTREEIRCMNPNYTDFRFPQIKAHPWHKIFHKRMPPEAIDLVSRLLQYSPSLRCTALEACAHSFFDELREPNCRLPNGRPLPPLFNFNKELAGASPELIYRLIPEHIQRQMGLCFPHPAGS
ncbi:hypothetical protein ACFE04_017783 [Oxalis oulophora]